jgi:hypothetical protein
MKLSAASDQNGDGGSAYALPHVAHEAHQPGSRVGLFSRDSDIASSSHRNEQKTKGIICRIRRLVADQKRILRGPIKECHQSPYECCDSSLCFIVTRTRSSEERVLSTATLRTMLPFNPVSPACFDPLTVMM